MVYCQIGLIDIMLTQKFVSTGKSISQIATKYNTHLQHVISIDSTHLFQITENIGLGKEVNIC